MLNRHLTSGEISRFLAEETALQNRRVALHLLECERCRRAAMEELGAEQGEVALLAKVLPYDRPQPQAIQPARSGLRLRLGAAMREVNGSGELFAQLSSYPLKCWPLLVRNRQRYQTLGLAQLLVEEGLAAGYEDAERGRSLAEVGLLILDHLEVRRYGQALIDDVSGRAWCVIGNAHRLQADFEASEYAFEQASELLADSSDPIAEGDLLYLWALVNKDRHQYSEALHRFDRATVCFEEAGDELKAARVLTSLGNLYLEKGAPEDALSPLLEAIARSDEEADPKGVLFARSNLALCFADLGEFHEARSIFEQCEEGYRQFGEPHVLLRGQWLEGMIAAGLGENERAEELLLQVYHEFRRRDEMYEIALVSLDLALLLNRQGRFAEVRDMARESLAALVPTGVFEGAAAALAVFHAARHKETVAEDLLQGLSLYLKRARTAPIRRSAE
ncbi:MAG: tetratricopeptide repeat protein [Acidobacteriota bacterium]